MIFIISGRSGVDARSARLYTILRELGSLIRDRYPEFTSLSGVKSGSGVYSARL